MELFKLSKKAQDQGVIIRETNITTLQSKRGYNILLCQRGSITENFQQQIKNLLRAPRLECKSLFCWFVSINHIMKLYVPKQT